MSVSPSCSVCVVPPVCINDMLPAEILSIILRHFSVDYQVDKLLPVCHVWRDVICDGFKAMSHLHFTDAARSALRYNKEVFSNIITLDVNISDGNVFLDLEELGNRVNKLITVRFRIPDNLCIANSSINTEIVIQLLIARGVRQLHFEGDQHGAEELTSARIILYNCIEDAIAKNSNKTLQQLSFTNMPVCYGLLDKAAGFTGFTKMIPYLPALTFLDLRDSSIAISNIFLNRLNRWCHHLKFLGISSRIHATVVHLKRFCQINFKSVSVGECIVSRNNMPVIHELLRVSNGFLSLICQQLFDEDFRSLVSGLVVESLEELHLRGTQVMTTWNDYGQLIAYHFPNLRKLSLRQCFPMKLKLFCELICTLPRLSMFVIVLCRLATTDVTWYKDFMEVSAVLEVLSDVDRNEPLVVEIRSAQAGWPWDMPLTTNTGRHGNICVNFLLEPILTGHAHCH